MNWHGFEFDEAAVRRLERLGAHVFHKYVKIDLHHFALGRAPAAGFVVDHINGDQYDNRRANLQVITQSQNTLKACWKHARSGRRNVFARKGGRTRYEMRVTVGGRVAISVRGHDPDALARQADAFLRTLKIRGMRYNFPRRGEYDVDGRVRN